MIKNKTALNRGCFLYLYIYFGDYFLVLTAALTTGVTTLTILQVFRELSNFLNFLVANLTTPTFMENRVSSLPFLTFWPG